MGLGLDFFFFFFFNQKSELSGLRTSCSAVTFIFDKKAGFFLIFLQLVLSHWDFSPEKFWLLYPGKSTATESCYPTYGAFWVF